MLHLGLISLLCLPIIVSAQSWSISAAPKAKIVWQDQRSNQFAGLKELAQFSKVEAQVGIELGIQYQRAMTISWLGYTEKNQWNEQNKGQFREAYLGHEWVESGLEVSLGRRIIRQGTGYIARPTSLLEGYVQRQDPEDHWGELLGSDMLFLQWFQEASTLSFAITDSDKNLYPRERPDAILRYETLLGNADFALVTGFPDPTFGLAYSNVFGKGLELHADILTQRGTKRAYHRVTQASSEPTLYTDYPYLSPWEESGRFFLYSVLGGQYSLGAAQIIFEWLHDSRGLSRSQFKQWSRLSQYHRQIFDTQPALRSAAQANLLWDLNTLTTQGNSRDYLFLRIGKNTGALQPAMNLLVNAQDQSYVLSPEIRYLKDHLAIETSVQIAHGAGDTEFGSVPQQNIFIVQLRYQFF